MARPRIENPRQVVSVRLTGEMKERLVAVAAERGTTITALFDEALLAMLNGEQVTLSTGRQGGKTAAMSRNTETSDESCRHTETKTHSWGVTCTQCRAKVR